MEVVGLVVGVVDGDYLMMVEVVEEDCSMNVHARFDLTISKVSIIEFER